MKNLSAINEDKDILTKESLLHLVYPIGSVYMSINNVSPQSFLGGTWERIEDLFLLAAGSTYAPGSTGGEAEHTLTVTEMPSHNHTSKGYASVNSDGTSAQYKALIGNGTTGTYATNDTGDGQPHNNMPPYLAVYMWKRIA